MSKPMPPIAITIDARHLVFESCTPLPSPGEERETDSIIMLSAAEDQVMICGTEQELIQTASSIFMAVLEHKTARENQ